MTIIRHIPLILVCLALVSCAREAENVAVHTSLTVDSLNNEAFTNRYDAPDITISLSKKALRMIDDSIPGYDDGRLRAWNNIAKAYYIVFMPDSSTIYADSVLNHQTACRNKKIEQLIAKLTHARVRQRNCDIAGSYRMLYDIAQTDILNARQLPTDNILYNYATSEYYATLLSLNYFYRKGMQKDIQSLLDEAEQVAPKLKCDLAQSLVTNYSLAYGHLVLCNQADGQADNLRKALQYIQANLDSLLQADRFSLLHFANTVQLTAAIAANQHIEKKSWQTCAPLFDSICDKIEQQGIVLDRTGSLAMSLYIESSYMFEDYGDPYHTLGAMVATGNLCIESGDTAAAQTWFLEAYDRLLQNHVTAPKYESSLYNGLLRSHATNNPDEAAVWAQNCIALHDYIAQNQEADFALQTQLANAENQIKYYRLFSFVIVALAVMLVILAIRLAIRTRVLRREKKRLQQMRRKDVERIANVETCLSVMRHDINPFVSYLQNKNLPDSLHQEVLSQLIRTFENIKNWTNLSIPSGLAFNASVCTADNIIDEAIAMNPTTNANLRIVKSNPYNLKIYGDRLLLIIMLRNLLANALQHTASGQVTLGAQVAADDTRFVELTVSDTGCGMSDQELENLFRADKKIDQNSQHSGFGLILCRYIAKKHDDNTIRGCRIWAESVAAPAENHGTTIHVCLQMATNQ
mgnify:FL=1